MPQFVWWIWKKQNLSPTIFEFTCECPVLARKEWRFWVVMLNMYRTNEISYNPEFLSISPASRVYRAQVLFAGWTKVVKYFLGFLKTSDYLKGMKKLFTYSFEFKWIRRKDGRNQAQFYLQIMKFEHHGDKFDTGFRWVFHISANDVLSPSVWKFGFA